MDNLIFGPAMIPDKLIYRKHSNSVKEPHYVYFDVDTIKQIRNKFHKKHFDNNVNINHDGIAIKGVILTKSFILDDENRDDIPESFQDLPNGTWMIEYRVDDEEIWQLIVDKKLNGFSVEGIFTYEK